MIATDRKKVLVLRLDLAQQIGRREALLLGQIDYWLERTHNFVDGHFWVYNSAAQWGQQLGLSVSQVKEAAASLARQGLILRRRLGHNPYDRTYSYTICYERLREMGFAAGRRGIFGRELAGEGPAQSGAELWDSPLAGWELNDEEAGLCLR